MADRPIVYPLIWIEVARVDATPCCHIRRIPLGSPFAQPLDCLSRPRLGPEVCSTSFSESSTGRCRSWGKAARQFGLAVCETLSCLASKWDYIQQAPGVVGIATISVAG